MVRYVYSPAHYGTDNTLKGPVWASGKLFKSKHCGKGSMKRGRSERGERAKTGQIPFLDSRDKALALSNYIVV